MPLRKQVSEDASVVPSESQQVEPGGHDHDHDHDHEDEDEDELSPSLLSVRQRRRRERENKPKPKGMTEEEMMDLALRLSEQEASSTALRMRQEEEAVRKAIEESMVGQRRPPCPNRKRDVGADLARGESLLFPEAKGPGEEGNAKSKERRRREGGPLLEAPEERQAQSECPPRPLDSPRSPAPTQLDDPQLRESPVLPLAGGRPEVHVPRLSQDLLETCRTSGFVLCSQDSVATATQASLPARPESPTFPRSPGNVAASPNSAVSSESGRGDDGETELSAESVKSPVFGRSASPRGCKPHGSVCSPTRGSSGPTARRRPDSPVSPETPAERSPVFGPAGRRREKTFGGSDSEVDPSQSPSETDRDGRFNEILTSGDAREQSETSKRCSDMTLLWSDADEDVTPAGSPSPVFPEERPVHRAASLNHVRAAAPEATAGSERSPRCVSGRTLHSKRVPLGPPGEPAGGPTVHYYWGVPFCPRGLDPDAYTQVILAQMQVYDRSLKRAQRSLLRKAPWGEAVLPQPEKSPARESPADSPQPHVPRRHGLRLRGKKLCGGADTPPGEANDDDEEEEEEEEGKKDGEEEEDRGKENKRGEEAKDEGGGGGDTGQVDVDDCEVCPETQLSDDGTQDLTMAADAGAELRAESPDLAEVEMILRDDSPAGAGRRRRRQEEEVAMEAMEVDAAVDGEAEASVTDGGGRGGVGRQSLEKEEATRGREDPDVEEIQGRGLQRSTSPELEPAAAAAAAVRPSPEASVDCPICQGSFPATKIELHAAYCDGEVAVVGERRPGGHGFQASLKPRRKRTRRAEVTGEETNHPSNAGENVEKCYVCQKAVPLRDYSRHTEHCIRRQASRSEAVSASAASSENGNLLSALDQTEIRDSGAGPSASKLQPGEVIDLRDDDDEDEEEEEGGGVSAFRISNSPIRSFTPISEAAGCLIDFKKQRRAKKPSQR